MSNALGVWIDPKRTPVVDFSEIKAKGATFVVTYAGEGTGDANYDKEDHGNWFSNSVNGAYQVDLPCFAFYQFDPHYGADIPSSCVIPQLGALNHLLENKTIHGVLVGNKWLDPQGKPISPAWCNERKRDFVSQLQKAHSAYWVGPYNGSSFRSQAPEMETWIGRNGVALGSGPALFWGEWIPQNYLETDWAGITYPDYSPKYLPMDPDKKGSAAKWWLWQWATHYKLPGFYMNSTKTTLGNPWLVFFNGDVTDLHKFAFYTPHNPPPVVPDPTTPPTTPSADITKLGKCLAAAAQAFLNEYNKQ